MKRKDGHQLKTIVEQVIEAKKPSTSRYEENSRMGEDFPGRRLQLRSRPFQELWKTPQENGNFGTIKSPKEALPDERLNGQRPGDKIRADTPKYIGRYRQARPRGKNWKHHLKTSDPPPPKTLETFKKSTPL